MALQLGTERRVTEVQIRADTIPSDGWGLSVDDIRAHRVLAAYGV